MKNCSFISILVFLLIAFTSCQKESLQTSENGLISTGTGISAMQLFAENNLIDSWSLRFSSGENSWHFNFNSDKTACYWEQEYLSRKDKKSYTYWELIDLGNDTFSIMVKDSNSNNVEHVGLFNVKQNFIQIGTLIMTRNDTNLECE